MLTIRTLSKTSPLYNQDERSRQIDELQRISRAARDEYLGPNWFNEVADMYSLKPSTGTNISFRPAVNIPQLVVLSLCEAVDLSDCSPKIYLSDRQGKRYEERERSFQQQWRISRVNYSLLYAALWAQLAGIGWIQAGYDPFMNDGDGDIWVRHRSPETVDIDPAAIHAEDRTFEIVNDRMYKQQLMYHFPEAANKLPESGAIGKVGPEGGTRPPLAVPAGPMSATQPLSSNPVGLVGDGRFAVRSVTINDNTIEVVTSQAGSDAGNNLKSIFRRAYPKGRYIVDADGIILADGDNHMPQGKWSLIPVYGLPPLTNFYPPPPTRFTKDLESLAGRFLTQIFENCVRTNNGTWFVDDNTGIDMEAFGGLPGEVQVISAQSRIPEFKYPQAFHPQMLELPKMLLSIQKELQGFTPSREGSPGAGNISGELYEASIFQSKKLTRLRAKLLANSVYDIACLLYGLMAKYFTRERAFPEVTDQYKVVQWSATTDADRSAKLYLDEASIEPISQAALRQMAPMLRQTGALDVRSFLEALGVPGAADIANKVDREQMLAALNRLRRR